VESLFEGYETRGFFDEMFEDPRRPRRDYGPLFAGLSRLRPDTFAEKNALAGACYLNEGITFAHEGHERPFPFDLLPRLIAADDWAAMRAGLVQRVRALDLFLADVYGPRRCIADGVVPNRLVVSCAGFMREMAGIRPPSDRWVHWAGIDLVRDLEGVWRVLEDNLRTPSGLSYVVQNRAFMRRVFPEAFQGFDVEPVDDAPLALRDALLHAAPDDVREPRVAVLTPGPFNSAYYEHTFLAQQMGVLLVEGRDLVVRDRRVYVKTTTGTERVHVVYRRIDDAFLDPVCLRADSLLGVPGLMQAYRAGNVTICNAPGTGVADDKALYAYVPDLIRYYLGEEPLLQQVPTYLPERPEDRRHILANLDRLVVKAVDGAGGYGILIGPHATPEERRLFARRVERNPRGYIAQETVSLSRAPVYLDGRFRARHIDLRPFVAYGAEPVPIPGGLTRVALRDGSLVVNSSQGGGSKDTWVLAS
jgi:uncharacterized circularly permuted ATP-grasp superfamily protein